jgi:hypothetical protein
MKQIIWYLTLMMSVLFLASGFSNAQVSDIQRQTIESLVEELISNDENLDYSVVFENLNELIENPLSINSASESELARIPFLTSFQIKNIQNYIKSYGKIVSIYEMRFIVGLTTDDILKLKPFLTFNSIDSTRFPGIGSIVKKSVQSLYLRTQWTVQPQKGFTPITDSLLALNPNARFLGNKYRYSVRYSYHYSNKIKAGFVAEKDAGEEFFRGSQKSGFDYYSATLQFHEFKKIKDLVIGDFNVRFGQGLVVWSGFGFNKSSFPLNVQKLGQGISKSSSFEENRFMRGIALSTRLACIDITGFYSNKKRDASLLQTDISDSLGIQTN